MNQQNLFALGATPCRGAIILALLIFVLSGGRPAYGAGFQIPNQSLKAIGSAGANIAFTPGPDSAYYNPANMSFLADRWQAEISLTTLWLPEVEYADNRSPLFDGSSDPELFFIPLLHVTSSDYNDFRFGFSLTNPYGLAKSWDQPYPAATTRLFSLTVIEASPSLAYSPCDAFSVAAGLRAIYSEGEVESTVANPPFTALNPLTGLSRKVEGDDLQMGYNLAATLRPTPAWRLAATYRSKVDLDLAGDASLLAVAGGVPLAGYDGGGSLPLTLPAVLGLATSYSFGELTLEVTWNRTFWSDIETLDFRYDQSFLGTPFDGFDRAIGKDWDDSDALRFGLSYQLSRQLLATAGFAIDHTPVPTRSLGFELPDADGSMYGLGLLYTWSDRLQLGASYMYYHTSSRSVAASGVAGLPGIDGSFDKGGAHALTVGVITSF